MPVTRSVGRRATPTAMTDNNETIGSGASGTGTASAVRGTGAGTSTVTGTSTEAGTGTERVTGTVTGTETSTVTGTETSTDTKKAPDTGKSAATSSGTGTSTEASTETEATETTATETTATTATEETSGTVTQQTASEPKNRPPPPAIAPPHSPKRRLASIKSKNPSKAQRLAKARAELIQLKVDLMSARITEIEAESDVEDDNSSVATEAGQELRVHSWLENTQLLAIEPRSEETQPEPQPPAEPRVPTIAAVSWDTPATAPAGVTAALPPPLRPSIAEPSTSQPPPPLPTSTVNALRTELSAQRIAPPNTNATMQPPPPPAITAASWGPNFGPAPPHLNYGTVQPPPPPAITAASWGPNFGPAPPHPNFGTTQTPPPVITAASWQPNFVTAQPPQNTSVEHQKSTELQNLASAITQAVQAAQHRQPLRYTELPTFNGAHQDWLTFRAAYLETAHHFSALENMSRLRRSLRGTAKEAVQGLLITNADPNHVMKTLETRFGRPDSIATAEIERLRTLPRLTESPRELCTFATKIENIVGTLQALDCVYYLYNPEVTRNMVEKLTPTLKRQWYEYATTQPKGEPDLLKFSRFMQREAEICSPFAQPESIVERNEPKKTFFEGPRRQRVHTVNDQPKYNCALCEQPGHGIHECTRFKNAATDSRWDIAKKHRLCFRCLRFRSKQHSCKPRRCEIDGCVHLHHKLLHSNRQKKEENPEPKKEEQVHSVWTPRVSYLKIIPVHVSGPAGAIDTLALLDDGSTVTLVDAELATQIGANGPDEPLHITSYDGTTESEPTSRRVSFKIRGYNRREDSIQARTITNLQLAAQRIPKEALENCDHLKDLLAELQPSEKKPKILIGQDNWHLLLSEETRTGKRHQPVASLTPLGWVVHGSHTRTLGHRVNFIRHTPSDELLHDIVKDYITMDNLHINPKKPNNDPGEKALRILEENTTRKPDGRYQTALLWKAEDVIMPNNYDNTLRRLYSIESKLDRDTELKRRYTEQMEALVTKGYAEPAPPSTNQNRTWYLPHFAVVNPQKPEKLRVVHDAAAKTKGVSLNDQLLTGPDLLQPLPDVLMRFRQHPIAITADITEMFMQVELREQDRDALRYLWRGNRRDDHPPEQYRMKSLIFGASSSPATAIFVMNHNAERHKQNRPGAVEAIKKKHYMDDYLDSFENLEIAIDTAKQVRAIHRDAHFELKKWSSNSPALLEALGETGDGGQVTLEDEDKTERVLGLIWKPNEDRIAFNLNLGRIPIGSVNHEAPTKRQALRIVMSLFDPLGLGSPVTIAAKQILQEVWRRGTSWDDSLEADLAARWAKWLTHLRNLSSVSVPRCYPNFNTRSSLQLHVFTDASESAYATALYWRTTDPDGKIDVTLITAKAKVAPLKLTSIPRMELQAAVLGARMATAVKEIHEIKPEATYFWTDSRTTLTWIRTGSRSYKPYVAHRIAAIEEHSRTNEWRWVPTKLNVADDATRDVPDEFDSNHRWFNGPDFLKNEEYAWPTEQRNELPNTGEERTCHVTKQELLRIATALPDVNRFSKWTRYVRAAARTLQAVEAFKGLLRQRVHYKRNRKNPEQDPGWRRTNRKAVRTPRVPSRAMEDPYLLIPAEIQRRAETLVLRASQEDSFPEELKILRSGNQVAKHSRLYPLSIEYTGREIRLKSRIKAAIGIAENAKNPIILDGDHRATKLWIEDVHRRLHHAGTEAVVNECRQEHWVLRLRPTVKTIVGKCVRCRMRTANPPRPETGDLPPCRLAHHHRPFSFTGLDYFGPLSVTVGRSHQKRYVALFTCLTTRAVHLEVVPSLSADSAIMALRRMIARRGQPTQIWSDNGTNFHGAEKELRDVLLPATEKEASKRAIDWRFIPPGAPFMGGAWERLVRSVKTALHTVLHERHPSEETLTTLLTEVEYTVNSRPLTHVSVNPQDPEALTPNHFLLGGPGRATTPETVTERDLNLRASWRTSQRLADLFWARWLREYLPELRNRRDPHGRGPELNVGDLVQVVDGTLPRNMWARGRIRATYPGPDGIVRTVDVETRGGVLRRAAKKLVVIPTQHPAPSQDASLAADDARRENVQDT